MSILPFKSWIRFVVSALCALMPSSLVCAAAFSDAAFPLSAVAFALFLPIAGGGARPSAIRCYYPGLVPKVIPAMQVFQSYVSAQSSREGPSDMEVP